MSIRSPQKRTEATWLSFSPETLVAAQEAAQKAGETVPAFIGRAVTTQAQRDRVTQGLRSQAKETK